MIQMQSRWQMRNFNLLNEERTIDKPYYYLYMWSSEVNFRDRFDDQEHRYFTRSSRRFITHNIQIYNFTKTRIFINRTKLKYVTSTKLQQKYMKTISNICHEDHEDFLFIYILGFPKPTLLTVYWECDNSLDHTRWSRYGWDSISVTKM